MHLDRIRAQEHKLLKQFPDCLKREQFRSSIKKEAGNWQEISLVSIRSGEYKRLKNRKACVAEKLKGIFSLANFSSYMVKFVYELYTWFVLGGHSQAKSVCPIFAVLKYFTEKNPNFI